MNKCKCDCSVIEEVIGRPAQNVEADIIYNSLMQNSSQTVHTLTKNLGAAAARGFILEILKFRASVNN